MELKKENKNFAPILRAKINKLLNINHLNKDIEDDSSELILVKSNNILYHLKVEIESDTYYNPCAIENSHDRFISKYIQERIEEILIPTNHYRKFELDFNYNENTFFRLNLTLLRIYSKQIFDFTTNFQQVKKSQLSDMEKVFEIIKEYKNISLSELTRKTQTWKRNYRKDILNQLMSQKAITLSKIGEPRKKTTVFSVLNPNTEIVIPEPVAETIPERKPEKKIDLSSLEKKSENRITNNDIEDNEDQITNEYFIRLFEENVQNILNDFYKQTELTAIEFHVKISDDSMSENRLFHAGTIKNSKIIDSAIFMGQVIHEFQDGNGVFYEFETTDSPEQPDLLKIINYFKNQDKKNDNIKP